MIMKEPEKPLVIAIIPARGGSKGVYRKNIKELCGKPLISYTIKVANSVPLIDHVVVTTEDPEIAEISKHYGAYVPFMRPFELARDDSNLNDVMIHVHEGLKKKINFTDKYILISLFATSPFRNRDSMYKMVEQSIQGYNVVTVKRVVQKIHGFYTMNPVNNSLALLNGSVEECSSNEMFYRNVGLFLSCNWGYETARPVCYQEVINPVELIDIDNYEDFFLAEEIVNHKLYDFGVKM